jgi:hypothetical protein
MEGLPRYNPLYAVFDPRSGQAPGKGSDASHPATPTDSNPQPVPPTETPVSPETGAFDTWMGLVGAEMEALCGLPPEDLPDCPYTDWYQAGMQPADAARETLVLAFGDDFGV